MLRFVTLAIVAAALSFGADVAGKWQLRSEGSSGDQRELEFVVQEKGGMWTGSLSTEDTALPVKELVVKGDDVSFTVPTENATYVVKLTVKADAIEGTFTASDGSKGTVKGKRA